GWHAKAEHCLRLDVRQLYRRGLLKPCSYSWRWTNSTTGEETGSVGIECNGAQLQLAYRQRDVDRLVTLALARTACTFGGSRAWFSCPACAMRCAVVYLRGEGWRCRRCSGVVYAGQSEDVIGRSWRRQWRIEARLGPYGARPARMHHATYRRLRAQLWACEEAREAEIAAVLVRLGVPSGAW
ncbi:MAG: hypothetical protein ACK57B_02630, partial [Betaproteobacteria bacterium]